MAAYDSDTNFYYTLRNFRNAVSKKFGGRVRREGSNRITVYISDTEFLDMILSNAEVIAEVTSFENSSEQMMSELEKLDGYDFKIRFVKLPTSEYEMYLNPFKGNVRGYSAREKWMEDIKELVKNNSGLTIKKESAWLGVTLKVDNLEMVGVIALHESNTIARITKLVQV